MDKSELFLKVGELISNTVYNRAIELYNTWTEYVEEMSEENDCCQREEFFEENGTEYAIFEDEVIGTEVFLSWVYSYGASMVLLEPRELVDKVIDSIEQRKLEAKQ